MKHRARLPGYLARYRAEHARPTEHRKVSDGAPGLAEIERHLAAVVLAARLERFARWVEPGEGYWIPTPDQARAWLACDAEGIHVRPGEDPADARARHLDPIGSRVREIERRRRRR